MRRIDFYLIFFLAVLIQCGVSERASCNSFTFLKLIPETDTLSGKQILYNGRIWRNLYLRVKENQFLFSKEFVPGSVIVSGKSFDDINLRYDIYNDEIMIITDNEKILQLNKEMVDSFSLKYENRLHQFSRLDGDSINQLKGYVDVLYNGKTDLYVKYRKEISRVTQGKMYDIFIQSDKVYLLKNGIVHHIKNKRAFLALLSDNKQQVKVYIKSNKIKVISKKPESFVAVLKFYDSLKP
jgi:sulfur transfer complex TusBCD TusB component (DsrH family)